MFIQSSGRCRLKRRRLFQSLLPKSWSLTIPLTSNKSESGDYSLLLLINNRKAIPGSSEIRKESSLLNEFYRSDVGVISSVPQNNLSHIPEESLNITDRLESLTSPIGLTTSSAASVKRNGKYVQDILGRPASSASPRRSENSPKSFDLTR